MVTDLCGVASRRILTALMSGVTDPAALVLLRGGLKVSAADLTEALTGRFTEHHAFMTRLLLNRIDQHNAAIQHLEQRIEQKINSLDAPRDLLTSIPGVSRTVADIIIAETGADMTAFPSAAHLCSWAGVSPGQHESAGRRKTAPTRAGNLHLKAALGTAAMSTTRQRNTYFCAKYRRIAARRGKLRAVVAIERAILTAVWHMLSTGTYYQDPGPDYYSRHDPSKRAARAVRDLQALGYQVTVHPVAMTN